MALLMDRYFPYYITVGSLAIVFIVWIFFLISQRRLLPAIVMIGAFMLFVLWVVGLVVVATELFGPGGSVQSNCELYVFDRSPKGQTVEVLAYLQQRNICEFESTAVGTVLIRTGQSWYLVFSMGLVGSVFLVWVMIIAYQVFVDS